jgi:peptidoglycan/LPS O-acetylase OafA/YrhL
MQTIGQRLDERSGIAPGFDALRIFLACSIVAWHVNAIVTGDLSYNKMAFVWVFGYFTLAAFFSLSGFLIAGSALRLSLGNFLVNRGLRIVPALAVEVVLSALILGPLVTALSVSDYFANHATWKYFTNMFGWINYVLPGVFTEHPTNIVNNTLWTVPHEIGCYAIMSGLIVFGLLRKPWLMPVMVCVYAVVGIVLARSGVDQNATGLGRLLYILFVGKASRLYIGFVLGIAVFLIRHRLPYSRALFLACLALCVAIGAIPQPNGVDYPMVNLILAPAMAYMTAFIGVTDIWIPDLFRKGDYSYGIYLYGWPMQQVLVEVMPSGTPLAVHFLLVIPMITIFAAFSWHAIEKPILKLRKRFSFVARVRLEENPAASKRPEPAASAARQVIPK